MSEEYVLQLLGPYYLSTKLTLNYNNDSSNFYHCNSPHGLYYLLKLKSHYSYRQLIVANFNQKNTLFCYKMTLQLVLQRRGFRKCQRSKSIFKGQKEPLSGSAKNHSIKSTTTINIKACILVHVYIVTMVTYTLRGLGTQLTGFLLRLERLFSGLSDLKYIPQSNKESSANVSVMVYNKIY